MLISKSMTKDVITIKPGASVFDAKAKMTSHGIRHLPVVDSDEILIGIVTDRDIRSALPYKLHKALSKKNTRQEVVNLAVKDIMTADPYMITPYDTLQDVLLLFYRTRVGAFPVVDKAHKVIGIISERDLLRAFIYVLGIEHPGTLLGIVAEEKTDQMKRIVDAITDEDIPMGSILVAQNWDTGKRAVFPYLLSKNVKSLKQKLDRQGYTLIDPLEWYIDRLTQPRIPTTAKQ